MPALPLILSILVGQVAPDVVVDTVDGPRPAAPLLEIGADFTLKLGGAKPAVIDGKDVIALRRVGASQPGTCPHPYLQLTTGDKLPLTAFDLDDETLRVTLDEPFRQEKWTIPQSSAAWLVWSGGESALEKDRDAAYLKNGDRLAGKLTAIDAQQAALVVDGMRQSMPLARISAVSFNPAFQSQPTPKAPYADVVLTNGSRLMLAKFTSAGDRLAGVNLFGQKLTFPVADLAAMRIRGGKATYLDDLKPASYESTPFLDVAWPLTVGRTVAGGPLKIADDVYPFGLGMHSRSRATFTLDGKFAWFEALVAVDKVAGPHGEVKIDVEVDGKSTGPRLVSDARVPLRIDVRNAKSLTLITDFGPRGDVQGHAIWADARVVEK